MADNPENRRPIRARGAGWASRVARSLRLAGVRPNQISVASVVFAAGAGALLVVGGRGGPGQGAIAFLAAAVCIQLRLLCNLFDGMVAVEGGLKSKSGEIYNDLPDRLADPIILICAGYSLASRWPWGVELGALAALLAVLTAYVRLLGAAAGAGHDFSGPMAKQHRMAVMTAACLAAAAESLWGPWPWPVLAVALAIVAAGCLVTAARRTVRIVRRLESQ
ncbi:MAG: CDP-alcohol phosphatidyltransferase family protein [Planctomycetota bacterium]|nr:CDP-alcohol phosphatidyltransferase family protein [Planctomycetota bacterium]